jgi:hypothetical protein
VVATVAALGRSSCVGRAVEFASRLRDGTGRPGGEDPDETSVAAVPRDEARGRLDVFDFDRVGAACASHPLQLHPELVGPEVRRARLRRLPS